ncbi:MAG: M48 family metalloprotease [Candidatus Micrarchaeota archaeon]|nr:M48 family metalloprotease [Candidatus Micrarchaeota archaeon]
MQRLSFYDEISANKRNSYILVFLVFVFAFAAAYVFSLVLFGESLFGLLFTFVASSAYIYFTYSNADKILLGFSGAREAKKEEFPYLVNVVEGLSIAAGIPTPKIYVIDDPAMNAFATGLSPQKASVAFTTGLLSNLNRAELEGVAAHEISHIKNYDSRLATLMVVMVGLIAILSDVGLRMMFRSRNLRSGKGGGAFILLGLVVLILAPFIAQIVRLALSRRREYLADATAAQLTRYPEGLASALEKIKKVGSAVKNASDASAPIYFANPISVGQLFSTHPPIDERIRRLRSM